MGKQITFTFYFFYTVKFVVPGCFGPFRCSGVPVFHGVPGCSGVPVFRSVPGCSGVPGFSTCPRTRLIQLSRFTQWIFLPRLRCVIYQSDAAKL